MIIMYLVKKIRKEDDHYLSVPNEVLSWVKVDRIMKIGHAFPSVILTLLLGIKLLPLISVSYAEQLEKNATIVPITLFCLLIPILILNGILIETILESSKPNYKKFKQGEYL